MNRIALSLSHQSTGLILLTAISFGGAYLVSRLDLSASLIIIVGLALGTVAFLRTEIAIYLIIVAMLLSPEIGLGDMSGQREKGITLRFDDYLLVIVGMAWFFKTAVYKELNLLVHTRLNKPIYLYATACILSTLLGMQTAGTQEGVQPAEGFLFVLKYLEYFFLFWMVLNSVHDLKQIRRFVFVLFLVAGMVGLIAALQIPSGARVSAPFQGAHGEPNTLASYLLFIIALVLGIALTMRSLRWPLIALAGFLVLPFAYTLSRSAYLAFGPMLLLLFVLTRKYLPIAVLAGALVVGFFAPAIVLPKVVVDRIVSTFGVAKLAGQSAVQGRRFDMSTEQRLLIFQSSVQAFQQKPVFGWGVTGWRFIDSQYFRVLVETGLVGISLFLFLLYRILSVGWTAIDRFRGRDPFLCGLACGFVAGTVGLAITAIGANVFVIVRVMEPFWLVCAMLAAVVDTDAVCGRQLSVVSNRPAAIGRLLKAES